MTGPFLNLYQWFGFEVAAPLNNLPITDLSQSVEQPIPFDAPATLTRTVADIKVVYTHIPDTATFIEPPLINVGFFQRRTHSEDDVEISILDYDRDWLWYQSIPLQGQPLISTVQEPNAVYRGMIHIDSHAQRKVTENLVHFVTVFGMITFNPEDTMDSVKMHGIVRTLWHVQA
jgi:hypothetical protein